MEVFFIVVGLGITLFVVAAAHDFVNRPECPFCHARGSFAYRFRRVDGGPDLRYGNNHVICVKCGNKFGDKPPTPEETAELEHWRKHGFDTGRAGREDEIPVEIRPLAGTTTKLSAAWYTARHEGFQEFSWEQGFAEGIAGLPRPNAVYNAVRAQAWQEGDAKRQGLHYFPSPYSTEKIKDI